MSPELELYCTLREIEVPAEKARAVAEALKAARTPIGSEFSYLNDPQIRQREQDLLDLRFKVAADTVFIRVMGIALAVVWLDLMLHHLKW